MEYLEIILSIAATVVGLLITTFTFIAKFIKSSKAKKTAENLVEIGDAVLPFIEQAEQFSHYTGEEKKEYVMTKANQYALENNIPFNEELVNEWVEEIVALTKQVNAKNKEQVDAKTCSLIEGNIL